MKIFAIGYNAGLNPESRIAMENGLMKNEWKCVVSCDNTGLKKLSVIVTHELTEKLKDFRENYFPELEVKSKGSNIL